MLVVLQQLQLLRWLEHNPNVGHYLEGHLVRFLLVGRRNHHPIGWGLVLVGQIKKKSNNLVTLVLCWIWDRYKAKARSIMSEWITITMHSGAFLMWVSITTTLIVFHTFQSLNTDWLTQSLWFITQSAQALLVIGDGNIMLINIAAGVAWPA